MIRAEHRLANDQYGQISALAALEHQVHMIFLFIRGA